MKRLSIFLAGWILLAGCSPTIRDCEVTDAIPDSGYDLEYSAVMPSNCPVPIGTIGAMTFMGATLTDPDTQDYRIASITVDNSEDDQVGNNLAPFIQSPFNGVWTAQPRVEYPAATGYSGSISSGVALPEAARDKGFFLAVLLTGSAGAAGRLHVNYVGTTVQASVAGEDVPRTGTSNTWTASASGGTPAYSYAWYKNGSLVSTSSSYAETVGSSEFGLRLVVTDQTYASRWKDFWVDVDGIRSTISGPSTIYYSNGDATWTISNRGGYSPYSVNWYFQESFGSGVGSRTYAGSGLSLTSYPPAAGPYIISAEVTDSNGRTTSASDLVHAIGDGNGGCVPVPPQIICSP